MYLTTNYSTITKSLIIQYGCMHKSYLYTNSNHLQLPMYRLLYPHSLVINILINSYIYKINCHSNTIPPFCRMQCTYVCYNDSCRANASACICMDLQIWMLSSQSGPGMIFMVLLRDSCSYIAHDQYCLGRYG